MKNTTVYVGFIGYAGYSQLVVAESEEECWKAMKKEYYKWRKTYNGHRTFKEAIEYFGYYVDVFRMGEIRVYSCI